jgi:hypothetical protein
LDCFTVESATKQLTARETIFRLLCRTPETPTGYHATNKGRRKAPEKSRGDRQMRTVSLILALAFVLVGPSMAGSTQGSLPGIGTFTYNGSPIVTPAKLVVAVN